MFIFLSHKFKICVCFATPPPLAAPLFYFLPPLGGIGLNPFQTPGQLLVSHKPTLPGFSFFFLGLFFPFPPRGQLLFPLCHCFFESKPLFYFGFRLVWFYAPSFSFLKNAVFPPCFQLLFVLLLWTFSFLRVPPPETLIWTFFFLVFFFQPPMVFFPPTPPCVHFDIFPYFFYKLQPQT